MEGLAFVIILYVALTGVHRLFRVWTMRAGPDGPGAVAVLVTILLAVAALILFNPGPVRVPAGGGVAGTFGYAMGHGIARAVVGTMLYAALGLTALMALAMGLGIAAGVRRRPPQGCDAPGG
jgi:hypothetical protein